MYFVNLSFVICHLSLYGFDWKQPGCGLGGDPRPGTNGWNAPYETAKPWLVVYRNETLQAGVPNMPVVITETGWCRDFCTEADRANWTVQAWAAWHADPQVNAACPFLLEGTQWEKKGFPWIAADGATRLPVYTETVALRCKLLPWTCTHGSGAGAKPNPFRSTLLEEADARLPAALSPTVEVMTAASAAKDAAADFIK